MSRGSISLSIFLWEGRGRPSYISRAYDVERSLTKEEMNRPWLWMGTARKPYRVWITSGYFKSCAKGEIQFWQNLLPRGAGNQAADVHLLSETQDKITWHINIGEELQIEYVVALGTVDREWNKRWIFGKVITTNRSITSRFGNC